ncbi:hypothetical protein ACFVU0_38755, partial [Streptomyces sp. NPDC058122]
MTKASLPGSTQLVRSYLGVLFRMAAGWWSARRKRTDRVWLAGKGNAKADYLESTEEIGYGNGLIESETQDR